ncbi:MAG TPA: GNAT family N-acetyltransferase [Rhodocyclaceae bacterium]
MNADDNALDIREVNEGIIGRCFVLMRQLRSHLASEREFIQRWRRQGSQGYRVVAVWRGDVPVALAGYRVTESLIHGRFLYVDDLVVDLQARSAGHGTRLMDWLKDESRRQGCVKLVLDTGLDNALAHRFYFRQGLLAMALRFNIPLK